MVTIGLSSVAKLVLTVIVVYVGRQLFNLTRNYLAARRTGLPVLVNPTSIASPVWLLSRPLLMRLFAGWDWPYRIDNGWTQHARYAPYAAVGGRALWVINPNGKHLYLSDPAAADEVLRRCREFIKNPETYAVMELYGTNLDSANGKVWERHRRVTVPPFNERASEAVWEETGRQVEGARRKWERAGVVRSTRQDTTRVAFNVLSATGFGVRCDFEEGGEGGDEAGGADAKGSGHRLSYRDALGHMLNNVVMMVLYTIVRGLGWPDWAMWGSLGKMAVAKNEFGLYMAEMLQQERDKTRGGGRLANNNKKKESLMSVLVKSSDQGMQQADGSSSSVFKGGPVLSDDEIYGNLFVYNIAGQDTTAGTMNYAIVMLAAEPEWQEWLAEELDVVLKEAEGSSSSSKYSAVFPKLSRCQAIMYETLRLYGPVSAVPRWTASQFVHLKIQGRDVAIPPDTIVEVDLASLHHDPGSWGADRLAFRPDRWLPSASSSAGGTSSSSGSAMEQQGNSDNKKKHASAALQDGGTGTGTYDWQSASLVTPTPGSFLPWTGGPRVCPGKKFSQVEFTRAMVGLFGGGRRVAIVPDEDDEDDEERARARVRALLRDPVFGITLRMRDSETVGLRWHNLNEEAGLVT